MKDVFFLSQKSEPAIEADKQIGQDLLDTLQAHKHECVGMAANMIGVKKNLVTPDLIQSNVGIYVKKPRI